MAGLLVPTSEVVKEINCSSDLLVVFTEARAHALIYFLNYPALIELTVCGGTVLGTWKTDK